MKPKRRQWPSFCCCSSMVHRPGEWPSKESTKSTVTEPGLKGRDSLRRVVAKATWWIPAVACILVLAAYANGIGGVFVYDDRSQIVDNHLIQENRFLWKALSEDVWAFKGERDEAWEQLLAPAFILWLIINIVCSG